MLGIFYSRTFFSQILTTRVGERTKSQFKMDTSHYSSGRNIRVFGNCLGPKTIGYWEVYVFLADLDLTTLEYIRGSGFMNRIVWIKGSQLSHIMNLWILKSDTNTNMMISAQNTVNVQPISMAIKRLTKQNINKIWQN